MRGVGKRYDSEVEGNRLFAASTAHLAGGRWEDSTHPPCWPGGGGTQHGAAFAKGGKAHMVKPQAAGPDAPGRTGKVQTPAPGARSARGGVCFELGLPMATVFPSLRLSQNT